MWHFRILVCTTYISTKWRPNIPRGQFYHVYLFVPFRSISHMKEYLTWQQQVRNHWVSSADSCWGRGEHNAGLFLPTPSNSRRSLRLPRRKAHPAFCATVSGLQPIRRLVGRQPDIKRGPHQAGTDWEMLSLFPDKEIINPFGNLRSNSEDALITFEFSGKAGAV